MLQSTTTLLILIICSAYVFLYVEARCYPDGYREDCGYLGIDEFECKSKGCCWTPDFTGVRPWCYRPLFDNQEGEERKSSTHDTCCPGSCRIDCGWAGMSPEECLDRGCCWDPLQEGHMGPWCYHKNCEAPFGNYCDSGALRIDCGHFGTDEAQCEARNCCWAPLTAAEEGPYCFFKNAPPDEDDACCTEETRRECGYCGIQQDQCVRRGCCWSPTDNREDTWCFEKNCKAEGDICDPDGPRRDCGYLGIDEGGCLANGCCWSPTEKDGEPWCYVYNGKEKTEKELEVVEEPPPTEERAAPGPAAPTNDDFKDKGTTDTGAFLTRTVEVIV